jgi:hypothetical protein
MIKGIWVLTGLLVALLVVIVFAGSDSPSQSVWVKPDPVSPAVRVEEDSPQWDCHTMGNHVCGVPESPVSEPSVRIEEDDPRWDCRTMGNRICG